MKRIVFFSLLITAVAGSVVLGLGVPKGHPREADYVLGQQTKEIEKEPADGQTISEEWWGTWQVTVAYRDHETGALVATDVSTSEICPGEPIIPPQLNGLVRCSTKAADNEINVSCVRTARGLPTFAPGCNVSVKVKLDSQRDGDAWSGAGSWSFGAVGSCGSFSSGEDFVVSGIRMSRDVACNGEGSSLVQSFFAHPELVPLLAEE